MDAAKSGSTFNTATSRIGSKYTTVAGEVPCAPRTSMSLAPATTWATVAILPGATITPAPCTSTVLHPLATTCTAASPIFTAGTAGTVVVGIAIGDPVALHDT